MKKGSVGFKPENLTQPDIPSTWKAMEALYDSGKARPIGVSNFSSKKLGDLLDIARVPPAVNQVECHPVWQQPKLQAFCKSKGVHLSGYSPLGSPGMGFIKSEVLKESNSPYSCREIGVNFCTCGSSLGAANGSQRTARINENFDVLDWSIPEYLFAKLSGIEQERLIKGTGVFVHETFGAYKTTEELWDGEL
ncbi:hypothetical protein ACB098_09G101200 [Castanea mollissima]